ncbi:hypothetical protein ACJRO7_002010 [Eucalyptus globulus]|uniref:Uncharacterized protein n=1 Tax=Eucalyptus globulus TaxID=34317 RepID=A0ABD3LWG0_EUCGL
MSKIRKQSKSYHQSSNNTSKVQGMVLPCSSQQPESKQRQSGQIQSVISGSLIKSLAVLDEFKYGFPSNGLYVTSNEWWGSGKNEGEKETSDATLWGASLTTAIRKRALEEGREALKLGVFMSHHAHNIGKEEKSVMLNIF